MPVRFPRPKGSCILLSSLVIHYAAVSGPELFPIYYHDRGRGYDPVGSQFHGSIGAGMNPISSLYIV
jgi:hypothetical protein